MNADVSMGVMPSSLSFTRGMVIGDAEMFNVDEDGVRMSPVAVKRHGIRGTQNLNGESINATGAAANTAEGAVSNIQMTDSAKLDESAAGMEVAFDVRFLPLNNILLACTNEGGLGYQFRGKFAQFLELANDSDGLKDVAVRYARNIANGRWLWRNRTIAAKIVVKVNSGSRTMTFDALSISSGNFDAPTPAELELGGIIAEQLSGKNADTLKVSAFVDFGLRGAVEVFPSQNYIDYGRAGKPSGFARSLYCLGHPGKDHDMHGARIMGVAAIRDQKVSNALRTIDTWYADYAGMGRPIAVEPNGANLEFQEFFRKKAESSFELIKHIGSLDPNSDKGKFMIACLVRGGVYTVTKEKDGGEGKGKRGKKAAEFTEPAAV